MITPEEIFVVSARLYDHAFNQWLELGHYANRPPGEVHGPFKAEEDVVILEVSSQANITYNKCRNELFIE